MRFRERNCIILKFPSKPFVPNTAVAKVQGYAAALTLQPDGRV